MIWSTGCLGGSFRMGLSPGEWIDCGGGAEWYV
jgi:hypothetical protein